MDKLGKRIGMTSTADIPDVRRLQQDSLPAGTFPAGGRQDFRVFFRTAVHEQIWKHASEDLSVEICGVLVGLWQRDDAGPFALISEYIRCDSAKSGFAEVTFTHDAWTKINSQMDTKFTDLKIVGWYHSHPNFGIFLSDRDIFIHEHFFSGPGQIAHVVDPVRKFDGVFAWQAGKPVLCPHFWVGERVCVTSEKPAENSHSHSTGLQSKAAAPSDRPEAPPSLFNSLTTVLLMGCVFLIGFMLPGKLTDWERRLEKQRDLLGVAAYFADHKLLRPGLDEDVQALHANLQAATAGMRRLADGYSKNAAPDNEALKEQWDKLQAEMSDADHNLRAIRQKGLLTPDEEAAIKLVEEAIAGDVKRASSRQPAPEKREPQLSSSAKEKNASSSSSSPVKKAKDQESRPVEKAKSKPEQE
jgi:proteasome lid subunit RPN8/RPN11